ncbi:MAG: YggT family protein [Treponema sp.]|nr:YggT family protein [Treponema sp.]
MKIALSILSLLVIIYTILCFINIMLTWIPGSKFTKFGRFISSICDPYMNLFSNRGWFRIRNLDFSPVISIGLLSILSSILGGISGSVKVTFGSILAMILSMVQSILSFVLGMLFLLMLIRWIVLLVNHGQTNSNSIWYQIDSFLTNISRKISGIIARKYLSYQTSLLISWITLLLVLIVSSQLLRILMGLCLKIPF